MNKKVLPAFIVNTATVEENIDFMLQKAKNSNCEFRPHFKTHQSAEIGKIFKNKSVSKITVSSLKMAEYFANIGFNDITIGIPVNINLVNEINLLSTKIKLNIIVSDSNISLRDLQKLSKNINVFIEIDTGYNRSGININNSIEINDLHKKLVNSGLNFAGFFSHFGNTYSAKSKQEITEIFETSKKKLIDLKQKYNTIISTGDTPSTSIVDNFNGIDEIRPGNFVYYDLMQYNLGVCDISQIASWVKSTIIAKYPERNQMIIHAGAVHLSKEFIVFDNEKSFGKIAKIERNKIVDFEDEMNIISLSQEHGIIQCTDDSFNKYNLYDNIEIIPVHSCLTANLMKEDTVYLT